MNTGRQGEKPATNRLSYGAADPILTVKYFSAAKRHDMLSASSTLHKMASSEYGEKCYVYRLST
jgi:hypothetical protein